MLSSGSVDSAQMVSSSDGNLPYTLNAYDYFGQAVAALGDLDGDGVEDVAVGSTGNDDGGANAGAIFVLFINVTGMVLSAQKVSNSDGNMPYVLGIGGKFGISVAGIGDFNSDGTVDLAVGAFEDDDGADDAGALHILFMLPDGTVASAQKNSNSYGDLPFTLGGLGGTYDYAGDSFGVSVTAIGDLNGDGVTDLAVGAYGYDYVSGCYWGVCTNYEYDRGKVYIIFMDADGTVSSYAEIWSNSEDLSPYEIEPYDYFGRSVAAIGDITGDGLVDVAIGATYDDDSSSNSGAVYIFALETDGSTSWVQKLSNLYGELPFALQEDVYFGVSLTAADSYKDGMTDLVVGASGDDDNTGAVYVLHLESTGCPPTMQPTTSLYPSKTPTVSPTAFMPTAFMPTAFMPTPQPTSTSAPPSSSLVPIPQPTPSPTKTRTCVGDGTISSAYALSADNSNLPFTYEGGDSFANSVAAIGDLNGDGVIDLVVGAYEGNAGGTDAGASLIAWDLLKSRTQHITT